MSIWFNFCASTLQRHHFVHLRNSLPLSETAANIRPNDVTGCRTCRGLGNTNLLVIMTSTDMWLEFCSKFCLDTVNLLEVCSVSEIVTAFWASPRFGHPHSQIPSVLGIPFSYYCSVLGIPRYPPGMPKSLVFWSSPPKKMLDFAGKTKTF